MDEIRILGREDQTGAYLLRIHVAQDLMIAFGRFRQGQAIFIPSGEYLYVGSAMAPKGSMTLARRLLRHASRKDRKRPQPVLAKLLPALRKAGLGPSDVKPPVRKTLFWNVDYLLEAQGVALTDVLILRSSHNLEDALARFLGEQPGCFVPAKGLGANDKQGQTHLLGFSDVENIWRQLPQRLSSIWPEFPDGKGYQA